MIPANRQNAVPLHVWAKAFFVACLIFGGGFGLFQFDTRDKGIIRYASNLHSGFPRTDVYILGSSLAARGFYAFGSLDSALFRHGLRLNYKLIFKSGALIGDFSPFLEEIEKAKPRAVWIESNILCADLTGRGSSSFVRHIASYRAYLKASLKRIAAYPIKPIFSGLRKSAGMKASDREPVIDERFWASYENRAKRYRVRKIDEFPDWSAFFGQAREAGIRIFFLDFPRSREATFYVPKEFLEGQEKLIAEFEERYHLIHVKFPRPLSQRTYFTDAAHFNREGARVFSDWFVEFLQKDDGKAAR